MRWIIHRLKYVGNRRVTAWPWNPKRYYLRHEGWLLLPGAFLNS
jgi:hypothetical protein